MVAVVTLPGVALARVAASVWVQSEKQSQQELRRQTVDRPRRCRCGAATDNTRIRVRLLRMPAHQGGGWQSQCELVSWRPGREVTRRLEPHGRDSGDEGSCGLGGGQRPCDGGHGAGGGRSDSHRGYGGYGKEGGGSDGGDNGPDVVTLATTAVGTEGAREVMGNSGSGHGDRPRIR